VKREPSSSTVISREKSQAPIDSRTRTKSPSDRNEHSHLSSSQSPPGQTHTHTDSALYSDIPTRSRGEFSHSESTRPEGAGGGGQTGDGGRQGGGISRKTTEAIHLAPTKASSSLPDQLSNKGSAGPASLLDSPARKSRDIPASSGDRSTRKEGMCMSKMCHFSLSLTRRSAFKSQIVSQACTFDPLYQSPSPPRQIAPSLMACRRLPVLSQCAKVKAILFSRKSPHQSWESQGRSLRHPWKVVRAQDLRQIA
jgi:hypothetical protein